MSTATVVLSEVDVREGSNARGPWKKFTLKDGNGQVVGSTFSAAVGAAADALKGERVELELEPAKDPKYEPTVKAVKPAPPEPAASNGDGMSKGEWAAKDRAADRRACIAIAAGMFASNLTEVSKKEDVTNLAARVLALSKHFFDAVVAERYAAEGQALIEAGAVPLDDEGIPF